MKGQQLDLLSWFTDVNKATNADQAIVQDDSGEGFVRHLHPVAEVLDHLQVDPQDTTAIAVSVLLKAIIGVAQKCRVERAVATLRATPAPANDSCARHVAAHAIHLAVYRCHIHWHPGVVLYPGHNHWQTMVFTLLIIAQQFHPLAIRSACASLFSICLVSKPPMLAAVLLTVLLLRVARQQGIHRPCADHRHR